MNICNFILKSLNVKGCLEGKVKSNKNNTQKAQNGLQFS